jgi:uncharacterized protein YqgC (DUF456 family)
VEPVLRVLGWILSGLLVLGGIAGVIVPVLPGALLVLAGLVLAAALDSFERVGWITLAVLGVLALASAAVDAGASIFGARRMKASPAALYGAALGTVAGLMFGIPGVVLGPFIGAVTGELIAKRDLLQAGRVGLGTWLGILLSTVLRAAIVCIMVGLFLATYFF